jgi:hypothetical protein
MKKNSYILALVLFLIILIFFIFLLNLKYRNFFKRVKGQISLNNEYNACNKCINLNDKESCKTCDSFLDSDFKIDKIVKSKNKPDYKGILSYSLFIPKGKQVTDSFIERYVKPLKQNIKHTSDSKSYFKDWVIRIYIAPSLYNLFEKESGCELFVMNKDSDAYEGSLWRFLACEKEQIPVLFLDADDDLKEFEEKHSIDVKNWLNSNKQFFKRNLSLYSLFVKISAGCWGTKKPIYNIKPLINKYVREEYGDDESFLRKEIYPLFQEHGYYSTGYVF